MLYRRIVTAVLVAVLTHAAPAVAQGGEEEGPISAELRSLFEADQADRSAAPTAEQWKEVLARDRVRRDRVVEIVWAGELKTAADYYHAARACSTARVRRTS